MGVQNGPRRPRPGAVSAPPQPRPEDDLRLSIAHSSNPGSGPGSPKADSAARFKGLNLLDEVVSKLSTYSLLHFSPIKIELIYTYTYMYDTLYSKDVHT